MREWLAQRPARQEIPVAKDVHRVDEQDVHIARKLPVLVAVVENRHLRAEMLDGIASRNRALRPDQHRHVGQMFCQHKRLIARRLRVHLQRAPVGDNADLAAPLRTVAAVQNDDAVAHRVNRTREMLCRRRLSRAADRDVAEADDKAGQLLLLDPAPAVHCEFQIHQLLIDEREYVEHAHDEPARDTAHLLVMDEIDKVGLEIRDLLRRPHAMLADALLRAQGTTRLIHREHIDKDLCRLRRRPLVLVDDRKCLTLKAFTLGIIAKQA